MKFIDLFAGLGGFHKALSEIGIECVFASEIDKNLQSIYYKNHGIKPKGDVRLINENEIPNHDVLCAGFPCQPFSIAGKRKGAKYPSSVKLIDDVIKIAKKHQPDYVFLENVPNIITIDNGKFWSYIQSSFNNIGYEVNHKIYSPVDFNILQNKKECLL
ncbi:DNA cytosine methyltransferase [Abyssogena phaseoliformis symbiont]|uniref:DNA cytosine methyltransferase n=1 Tax=Abyssogena phaseoliformis symbiont TaxID=596095 RepID=UPI0019152D05|nr:DNA (cytosine-5-)-methyltransferase [Abyssogena phaseoliformis symbiont]